jgi:hypothetical protein
VDEESWRTLFQRPEAAGHCLDGDESGVNGVVGIGDELKFEPSFFL